MGDFYMALVAGGFQATITVVDRSGTVTVKQFEMNVADQAEADTAIVDIVADFQAVTQSKVMKYTYGPVVLEDDQSLPTAPGAINAVKASCTLVLDELGAPKANYKIPAPVDAIFVDPVSGPGNNVVDTGAAALLAWFEHFTTTDGDLFISDGQTVIDTAFLTSGKRISAKSFNP